MTSPRPQSEPGPPQALQLDDRASSENVSSPPAGVSLSDGRALSDGIAVADDLSVFDEGSLVGESDSAGFSMVAPIDAAGLFAFDEATGRPHLVFASDGLAALVNRQVSDLIGHGPAVLFGREGQPRFDHALSKLGVSLGPRGKFSREVRDRQAAAAAELWSAVNPLGTPDGPVEAELLLDQASPQIDLATGDPSRPPIPRSGRPPMPPSADRLDPDDAHAQAADMRAGASPADGATFESKVFTAVQEVVSAEGRRVPVHATYTTVTTRPGELASVMVELRDLEQPSAEQLLADQAAVVRSLNRGHELGRLCHQVATQLERELDDGSRCWVSIADANKNLEPVLSGDLPFDTVAHVMAELGQLGRPASRRLVSVDVLSGSISALLRGRGVRTLWYIPLVEGAEGIEASVATSGGLSPAERRARADSAPGAIMGAVVVVTPRERPDRAAVRVLDHLTSVLQVAIGQASAEASLAHQTLHDPLTGLPNRALLVDRLAQAMARLDRDGVALSVFLVDIDGFKSLNDSHGAEVGDKVLLQVAARLLGVVRLGDTVGRLSNDQYLVMCVSGRGELDPAALGRRILRSLAEPLSIPTPGADRGDTEAERRAEGLRITASVGVVVIDKAGSTPEAVISNAETALSVAASKGRGCMAFFKADLQRHSVQRHQTEQALHRAIARDELLVEYQPLVEIRTGFMVGAEALVRWNRPGHGVLGPGEFIPLAEESHLIVELGNWVIDRVCADLKRWPRSRGRSPMVTVNLASRQVISPSLVPTVKKALARHDLPSSRLGFEITESMEIQDVEEAVLNLNRLKALGCRIAIDDFGIGHATLDYIRRFSMADALKIDRSFVAGLGSSQEDTAIVNASIALASSLGLQVVAEGVETAEQLGELRVMGARYAQGFFLAKPMPFETVLGCWDRAQLFVPPWE